MDACPEDLATSLREKDLPTLERVAKEADLFLKARNRKLCDQPRKVFQSSARPRMDSVRPLQSGKKFTGGQHAREAKTSVADQRSCFKCKKTAQLWIVPRRRLAVISLRKPFLSGEVKALCIPDAIFDVIVGNEEGARSPEDPDMSVMVVAATTTTQAKREAVTKPLRVPDIERHVGVDHEQLIKLQQEDPRVLALVDAGRTSQRGGKVVSFEKARGILYRQYEDLGRNVDVKQVVLPKPLREYVISVAHDSITGAHLGIRRTKDKVLSNFYWPGVDADVARYCQSCGVCQRTVKKGTVPRVPLEKVPLVDTPFKRVAIDLVGPINPPSEV
ncbi:gypsy retrotransposon integrase-like protein 1 [Plakobranchus ocellatus]|uniref:Gypsy retrotransposon integrase-like protein 1 n=1 Tax=Plakobranchus ocellatus TaxID=259542 RepID=A0AAV3ZRV5_9GAST|nr:gypsy retrotransposon integrase-like protein 1 [Plakobranchus ocellatus]